MVKTVRRFMPVLLVVALAVLVRLPSCVAPIGRDSGVFLYHGARVLAGELPYRDLWDHKPPGIYYLDALGLALGGLGGVRALEFLWTLAAAAALYRLARARLEPHAAFVASAAFLVASGLPGPAEGGNLTETYVVLPVILAMSASASALGGATRLAALAAGLGFGVALFFRQTALLPALVAVLALGLSRRSWRERLVLVGALGLGAALPLAAAAAYFASHHALGEAIDQALVYNLSYASGGVRPGALRALAGLLASTLVWTAPLAALALAGVVETLRLGRRAPPWAALALGWLVVSTVGVTLSGRYYGHYVLEMLAPAALLAGFTVAELGRPPVGAVRRLLVCALVILALLPAGHFLNGSLLDLARWRRGEASRQALAVARIRELSAAGDRIQVWGAEDALYFLSERRAASRYSYKYPLLPAWSGAYAGQDRRRSFADEIRAAAPALIVVDAADTSAAELEAVGLAPLLAAGYESVGTVGGYTFYRRRGAQVSAASSATTSAGR